MDACIGGIVWYSWGFSAAFGAKDPGGFIGLRKYLFCIGLDDEENGNYGYEFWFF